MPRKRCGICRIEKPVTDFGTSNGKRSDGYQAYCLPCARLNSQCRWHNMTIAQFEKMLVEQSGMCLICDEAMDSPEIDHDHSCCSASKSCGNCTRGLLCRDCNRTLGWCRDNPERLLAAAAYLLSFEKEVVPI
jgi:hypothetical protein